ncbi:MAG: DUF3999 family protein [Bacillota bacterium]
MNRAGLLGAVMALLAVGMALPARAGGAMPEWQFQREIAGQVPGLGVAGVYLPPEVYARSRPGLADLRVVDSSGRAVPFILSDRPAAVEREELPATMLDYSHGESTTVFLLDLGPHVPPTNGLSIQTPESSFLYPVEVRGSHDMVEWFLLGEGLIVDFQGEVHFRSLEVRYPQSTYRYLRVTVTRDLQRPLPVTGASAFFVPERQGTPLEAVASEYAYESRDGLSTLIIDLGYENLPSHHLVVSVAPGMFQRQVSVWGSNDREEWQHLAQGSFLSLVLADYRKELLEIDYTGAHRYLKMEIHDSDSPPLDIGGVDVRRYPGEVVFQAEPGKTYALYYGNPAAPQPTYDLETLASYVLSQSRVRLELGVEVVNPHYTPAQARTGSRPWLMWVIVTFLALVLSWVTWKKLASMPK